MHLGHPTLNHYMQNWLGMVHRVQNQRRMEKSPTVGQMPFPCNEEFKVSFLGARRGAPSPNLSQGGATTSMGVGTCQRKKLFRGFARDRGRPDP